MDIFLQNGDVPGLEKFKTVQDVLETNRLLISEINRNHELRTPEALARNVILIRQLNQNVSQVVEMYKEISGVMVQASNQGNAELTG